MQGLQTTCVDVSRLSQVDFDNLPFGSTFADHMFLCDFRDGKWCDPRIMPYQSLSLSPATSALHYGQSIFEGLKAFRQTSGRSVVFRPEDNHKR
ncbi:MAG: branched chain amino acid aminotransferase, partial [Bacteroidetes bacterium]|nr:branched chain amino acid aminotransferase [Bacteroidota bacterium]